MKTIALILLFLRRVYPHCHSVSPDMGRDGAVSGSNYQHRRDEREEMVSGECAQTLISTDCSCLKCEKQTLALIKGKIGFNFLSAALISTGCQRQRWRMKSSLFSSNLTHQLNSAIRETAEWETLKLKSFSELQAVPLSRFGERNLKILIGGYWLAGISVSKALMHSLIWYSQNDKSRRSLTAHIPTHSHCSHCFIPAPNPASPQLNPSPHPASPQQHLSPLPASPIASFQPLPASQLTAMSTQLHPNLLSHPHRIILTHSQCPCSFIPTHFQHHHSLIPAHQVKAALTSWEGAAVDQRIFSSGCFSLYEITFTWFLHHVAFKTSWLLYDWQIYHTDSQRQTSELSKRLMGPHPATYFNNGANSAWNCSRKTGNIKLLILII